LDHAIWGRGVEGAWLGELVFVSFERATRPQTTNAVGCTAIGAGAIILAAMLRKPAQ
jgi:hypothetical protein